MKAGEEKKESLSNPRNRHEALAATAVVTHCFFVHYCFHVEHGYLPSKGSVATHSTIYSLLPSPHRLRPTRRLFTNSDAGVTRENDVDHREPMYVHTCVGCSRLKASNSLDITNRPAQSVRNGSYPLDLYTVIQKGDRYPEERIREKEQHSIVRRSVNVCRK